MSNATNAKAETAGARAVPGYEIGVSRLRRYAAHR